MKSLLPSDSALIYAFTSSLEEEALLPDEDELETELSELPSILDCISEL